MKASWSQVQLSEHPEILIGGFEQLKNREVIEDFNGPQIIFAELRGQQLLGVAVDEDDAVDRWIFAPVSEAEKQALCAGAGLMREALQKDGAFVVDYRRASKQLHVRTVHGGHFADDLLPDSGTRLVPPNV